MTPQSWGGSRPNSGGSRPNSGPLKSRLTIRPFAHTEKGDSLSIVSIRFERCNRCGAIGWGVEGDEVISYRYRPEDNQISPGIAGKIITHDADCSYRIPDD